MGAIGCVVKLQGAGRRFINLAHSENCTDKCAAMVIMCKRSFYCIKGDQQRKEMNNKQANKPFMFSCIALFEIKLSYKLISRRLKQMRE